LKHSLSSSQFKLVFSESKSLRVGDLLFRYLKGVNPKLGLIVSKKYGNAVCRNLFKRHCRVCFQTLVKNGFSHTLIITPEKQKIAWDKINISFNILSNKINV